MGDVKRTRKELYGTCINTKDPVEKFYQVQDIIDRGSVATIKQGKKRSTNEPVVLKFFNKNRTPDATVANIFNEIDILSRCKHENIIQFIEAFETNTDYILIYEHIIGGKLIDRIQHQSNFTEREVSFIIYQLLTGVDYLHSHKIAHNKIRAEHILLTTFNTCWLDITIKLIHFSSAELFCEKRKTISFQSFEKENKENTIKNMDDSVHFDIFSVGIFIYFLFCGIDLIDLVDFKQVEKIPSSFQKFQEPVWQHISNEAKDFISKLLNNSLNVTAAQALTHPWISRAARSKNSAIQTITLASIPKNKLKKKRRTKTRKQTSETSHTIRIADNVKFTHVGIKDLGIGEVEVEDLGEFIGNDEISDIDDILNFNEFEKKQIEKRASEKQLQVANIHIPTQQQEKKPIIGQRKSIIIEVSPEAEVSKLPDIIVPKKANFFEQSRTRMSSRSSQIEDLLNQFDCAPDEEGEEEGSVEGKGEIVNNQPTLNIPTPQKELPPPDTSATNVKQSQYFLQEVSSRSSSRSSEIEDLLDKFDTPPTPQMEAKVQMLKPHSPLGNKLPLPSSSLSKLATNAETEYAKLVQITWKPTTAATSKRPKSILGLKNSSNNNLTEVTKPADNIDETSTKVKQSDVDELLDAFDFIIDNEVIHKKPTEESSSNELSTTNATISNNNSNINVNNERNEQNDSVHSDNQRETTSTPPIIHPYIPKDVTRASSRSDQIEDLLDQFEGGEITSEKGTISTGNDATQASIAEKPSRAEKLTSFPDRLSQIEFIPTISQIPNFSQMPPYTFESSDSNSENNLATKSLLTNNNDINNTEISPSDINQNEPKENLRTSKDFSGRAPLKFLPNPVNVNSADQSSVNSSTNEQNNQIGNEVETPKSPTSETDIIQPNDQPKGDMWKQNRNSFIKTLRPSSNKRKLSADKDSGDSTSHEDANIISSNDDKCDQTPPLEEPFLVELAEELCNSVNVGTEEFRPVLEKNLSSREMEIECILEEDVEDPQNSWKWEKPTITVNENNDEPKFLSRQRAPTIDLSSNNNVNLSSKVNIKGEINDENSSEITDTLLQDLLFINGNNEDTKLQEINKIGEQTTEVKLRNGGDDAENKQKIKEEVRRLSRSLSSKFQIKMMDDQCKTEISNEVIQLEKVINQSINTDIELDDIISEIISDGNQSIFNNISIELLESKANLPCPIYNEEVEETNIVTIDPQPVEFEINETNVTKQSRSQRKQFRDSDSSIFFNNLISEELSASGELGDAHDKISDDSEENNNNLNEEEEFEFMSNYEKFETVLSDDGEELGKKELPKLPSKDSKAFRHFISQSSTSNRKIIATQHSSISFDSKKKFRNTSNYSQFSMGLDDAEEYGILEGYLFLLEKRKKTGWHERYFICGENMLVWYKKNPKEHPSAVITNPADNVIGTVSLYSIVAITPCPINSTNTFYIDTPESTITLRSPAQDANIWISGLYRMINSFHRKLFSERENAKLKSHFPATREGILQKLTFHLWYGKSWKSMKFVLSDGYLKIYDIQNSNADPEVKVPLFEVEVEAFEPDKIDYALAVSTPHGRIVVSFLDEEEMNSWSKSIIAHSSFIEDAIFCNF